jgi:nucleoside-diphosphate-sugar epimerase
MARVLVTGASGFIGRHLCRVLGSSGDQVVALVRSSSNRSGLTELGVQFVEGDLSDLQSLSSAIRGCQTVYHLAGVTRTLRSSEFARGNVEGTKNLAQACAAATEPPVVVMVSSLAAVGPSRRGTPHTEQIVPRPVSRYGQSKLLAEHALREFSKGVPVSIVRPPVVIGEDDPALVEMIRPVARFGTQFIPTWADEEYSFIHVEDLAMGLAAVARRGTRIVLEDDPELRGVYFLSDDEYIPFAELGRRVAHALGRRRPRVIRAVWPLHTGVAACFELIGRLRRSPPPFNLDKSKEAAAGSWTCTSRRASDELGFAPIRSLTERVIQTARGYQVAGWI